MFLDDFSLFLDFLEIIYYIRLRIYGKVFDMKKEVIILMFVFLIVFNIFY